MQTYAERADQLRKQYAARLEALRNRKDLSDEGRQRHIAKLKVETSDAMRQLTKDDNEATEQRKRRLLDRVFGNAAVPSSQVVAHRDALDRAAKIQTAKEAADALELARFTGDHQLARAVAMRAYDRAQGPSVVSREWATVIDRWAEDEAPSVHEALTELSQGAQTHTERMLQRMQFSVSTPRELEGKNAEQLAMHADADDSESADA
jgi:hypothetical protein